MHRVLLVLALAVTAGAQTQFKGLTAPVQVSWDRNQVPHIYAQNDHDVMMVMGYVHARDRFFQMDYGRRQFSGTAAELLGKSELANDIQFRTLGLRRAAEASWPAYAQDIQALLQAYADGVNTWLHDPASTIPPEYAAVELTRASIANWSPIDTLTIAKGIAFGLSFDEDMSYTVTLNAYQQAGKKNGFDGTSLFYDDLFRAAPFDPAVTVPGFLTGPQGGRKKHTQRMKVEDVVRPEAIRLAEKYLEANRGRPSLGHRETGIGSNWWLVSGRNTSTGNAMLASDPHLALSIPSVWYEAHLNVSNDPVRGPLNVNGVSFPGTPGITLGCNDRICWGATVNPMDVTDTYQESLVFNFATMTPTGTVFENTVEPVQIITQAYRVNQTGDGVLDNLADGQVGPLAGGLTIIVPRRNNGPIISVNTSNPFNITGLSVQYTGWGPTCELAAFLGFTRAKGLDDFRQALRSFSFGSQNFGYADVDGNIAYFAGGAMPLREDLQTLGYADGAPPFLIRDGTHHFKNEWLPVKNPQPGQLVPYEILPANEMPQSVNPVWGYLINGNNDPVGITLTNSPLSFLRPGGGIYYLGPGYDGGFRAGRVTELIQKLVASGGKISLQDMQRIQANNQMLDAEVFTPYILAAFANAQANGAPAALAAMVSDAGIVEAVGRLGNWDFSTPTGIQAGYDPGDDASNLPAPSDTEIQNSVAATIYSVWRGQFLANTIDAALKSVGLASQLPRDDRSLEQLRLQLDSFWKTRGRGASGLNFFPAPNAPTPEAARDILILKSIRDALNLLAGSTFAPAFSRSTSQIDYRWGKLHRIVFDHPLGGSFNVPPAGGYANLAAGLTGIARSGGFEVVDASTHSARAAGLNSFMFDSGPSRRLVAEMAPAVSAFQAIPGGESGVATDPAYANMLGEWLTDGYHPLYLAAGQVSAAQVSQEQFTP